ncbi:hypothetical protein [Flavobacterium orientale]|uniref:Uncharacterized protein n=1 Tax=Flavobacterium orientale TaxID=1756020 RepID=A0A917DDG8_9FLAO|nr:hypothetical protein [Flavobacterium orientale]GGD27783.1 hypothetical protein GCM10011343_17450 [Flavobacterium orientale]
MITFIIIVVVLILAILGLVKFIDKKVNSKVKPVISIALWLISAVFAYLIYQSIQAPIKFDKLKEKRFQAAVNKMIDLKAVQLAYKSINGKYADNLDTLVAFIENEKFVILERKDTSIADIKKNRAFGLSVGSDGVGGYFKDTVKVREIGKVSIKDSLFKDSDRYKRLNIVRVDGIEATIDLKSGFIDRNDAKVPVFEAKLNKADLLKDQDQSLVKREKNVVSVDGINGEFIMLGSLEEVSMSGNWPKKYGNNE